METYFKLVGLTSAGGDIVATCKLPDKDLTFRSRITGLDDEKIKLWHELKGDWEKPKKALVQHNGLKPSGKPINPLVIAIEDE
jgi:hypothetical protein